MGKGFAKFLDMINFENPWVIIAMVVLLFWNIPLAIILRKNYMMEEKTKRIIMNVSFGVSLLLLALLIFFCIASDARFWHGTAVNTQW